MIHSLTSFFSMGGSVAVHVAARRAIRNLHGLVVVDVVEVSNSLLMLDLTLWLHMKRSDSLLIPNFSIRTQGTAMASLIHMQKILLNRAQHFPSIEKAVC